MVLGAILAFQQLVNSIRFAHLGIMPGSNIVCAETDRVVEKCLELDLGVTQHIRIGGSPSFVFGKKLVEYTLLVFTREIYGFQGNADDVRDRCGIDQILRDEQ